MARITANGICFQNEIDIFLTTCLEIQTYIKAHHVYEDIWTPEIGKQLEVRIKPDNCVDRYAVYMEKDKKVLGHLKKGEPGKFAKIIFYFLRSDPNSSCTARISGKRCNLTGADLEGVT